jgi:hypothetical protein
MALMGDVLLVRKTKGNCCNWRLEVSLAIVGFSVLIRGAASTT